MKVDIPFSALPHVPTWHSLLAHETRSQLLRTFLHSTRASRTSPQHFLWRSHPPRHVLSPHPLLPFHQVFQATCHLPVALPPALHHLYAALNHPLQQLRVGIRLGVQPSAKTRLARHHPLPHPFYAPGRVRPPLLKHGGHVRHFVPVGPHPGHADRRATVSRRTQGWASRHGGGRARAPVA